MAFCSHQVNWQLQYVKECCDREVRYRGTAGVGGNDTWSGLGRRNAWRSEIHAKIQRRNRVGHTVFRRELRSKGRIFQAEFVLFLLKCFLIFYKNHFFMEDYRLQSSCVQLILFDTVLTFLENFLGGSDSKASAYNVGDPGSIPGLGRSGEGNGNPLQYSCLENHVDRGAS